MSQGDRSTPGLDRTLPTPCSLLPAPCTLLLPPLLIQILACCHCPVSMMAEMGENGEPSSFRFCLSPSSSTSIMNVNFACSYTFLFLIQKEKRKAETKLSLVLNLNSGINQLRFNGQVLLPIRTAQT